MGVVFKECKVFTVVQKDFVLVIKTKSPIVFSVPHYGLRRKEFVGVFKSRPIESTQVEDEKTWHVVRQTNLPTPVASVARGLMPREIIDYNRGAIGGSFDIESNETAFGDPKVAQFYDYYHYLLVELLNEAKKNFGRATLLDIHGFSQQPPFGEFDIILGTANKETVQNGGDEQFADFFNKKGYRVFLPTTRARRGEILSGRFTVRRHAGDCVDAIQVEISSKYRKNQKNRKKLTSDMREFVLEQIKQIKEAV